MKIFIAKLPYQFKEADVTELFAAYGEVSAANVIMDRETGRSKCYAFIEMPNAEEAVAAISGLNNTQILDKVLAVSEAKERTEKPTGGGGYRGNSGYRSNNNDGEYRSGNSGGNNEGGYRSANKDKGNGGNYRDNDKRGGAGNRSRLGNSKRESDDY